MKNAFSKSAEVHDEQNHTWTTSIRASHIDVLKVLQRLMRVATPEHLHATTCTRMTWHIGFVQIRSMACGAVHDEMLHRVHMDIDALSTDVDSVSQ